MATSTEYPDLNTVYPSETAPPPAPSEYPTLDEVYGSSAPNIPSQPPQGVMGAVGAALQAQPGMMADALTNPVTQAKALPALATVGGSILGPGGATIGNIGGNLLADAALSSYGRSDHIPSTSSQIAQGVLAGASDAIPVLIKVPESLKSAGINATTLEHMAPNGQPPGDWAQALEKQLQGNGVLAKTANDTWKLMSSEASDVGKNITGLMNQIKQSSPEALQVNAQTALQPLANKVQEFGDPMYSAEGEAVKPYQEALNWLTNKAQQQGGKLTLDNIDASLQKTGNLMNGGQANVETFGPVYGKLADVRDTIVQNVAQQSGNPDLGTDLLKNNADYSTYMRLLPSIEKSGFREAVRAGISAYQKYGGPLITKVAAGVGIYDELKKSVGKVLGE